MVSHIAASSYEIIVNHWQERHAPEYNGGMGKVTWRILNEPLCLSKAQRQQTNNGVDCGELLRLEASRF